MANSTITSRITSLIDGHGVDFTLASTSITGSFAGGTSTATAYVDPTTFSVLANSPKASSTSPVAPDVCEPSLKIKKAGHPDEVASLKAPKGFKKLSLGHGAFDQSPSTITISS
jgi:hypothetical protein